MRSQCGRGPGVCGAGDRPRTASSTCCVYDLIPQRLALAVAGLRASTTCPTTGCTTAPGGGQARRRRATGSAPSPGSRRCCSTRTTTWSITCTRSSPSIATSGLAPKRGGLPRRRPGPDDGPRPADHGRGIPGAAPSPRALVRRATSIALAAAIAATVAGCGGGDSGTAAPTGESPPAVHRERVTASACPAGLPDCRTTRGRIAYVQGLDPDGDGDAHFVIVDAQGITPSRPDLDRRPPRAAPAPAPRARRPDQRRRPGPDRLLRPEPDPRDRDPCRRPGRVVV